MSWRPTLRIAARDARRAKARSILVIAMIGLPVLALAYADVMWRTSVPSAEESLNHRLGTSAAMLEVMVAPGDQLLQAPDPRTGWSSSIVGDGPPGQPTTLDQIALPQGARLVIDRETSVGLKTRAGISSATWTEVDLADPAAVGRWTMLEGRPAQTEREVVLTRPLLAHAGLKLGGTLQLTDPQGSYTVVGVAELAGSRRTEAVLAAPGTLIGHQGGIPKDQVSTTYGFVVGPPITWSDVLAFNDQGVLVTSRAVILDPPATTPFAEQTGSYGPSVSDLLVPILVAAMVVGLALLEVVLLAGAAFAVGARRQAHSLALIAASGGSRRDLRRVVLGGGVVLGLTAGVVGVILGTAAAFATRLALLAWTTTDVAGFDVRPPELLVVVVVGVVTGILAAVVPARQASRMNVVAALRGQRGSPPPSRRTPVVGVVMVIVGVALSVLGSGWAVAAQRSESLPVRRELIVAPIVLGAALVVLGLVVCSPTVVSIAARVAPRLPLAGRLALRDADRNRGRSAPAVAAVLAAVSGSVAVMLYVAALDQHDREAYTPGSPAGTATVDLVAYPSGPRGGSDTVHLLDPARVRSALGATLPVGGFVPITTPWCDGEGCPGQQIEIARPEANQCPDLGGANSSSADTSAQSAADPRCAPESFVYYDALRNTSAYAVGGPELLTLTGHSASPAASRVLSAGGVLVVDPLLLDADGKAHVEVATDGSGSKTVLVPGMVVPADDMAFSAVFSPTLATSLGVHTGVTTLLVRLDSAVSADEEDAARAALASTFGADANLHVERGYTSTYGLGLLALAIAAAVVTLGATGIATGLALTDARADHATLAAVGAAPRLRRRLAGAQALVLGFLGVTLGLAAGAVPALSIIGSTASLHVVWPWPQLAILVIGIPLLAGGAAFVFTRSRVPMQRRIVA